MAAPVAAIAFDDHHDAWSASGHDEGEWRSVLTRHPGGRRGPWRRRIPACAGMTDVPRSVIAGLVPATHGAAGPWVAGINPAMTDGQCHYPLFATPYSLTWLLTFVPSCVYSFPSAPEGVSGHDDDQGWSGWQACGWWVTYPSLPGASGFLRGH